MKIGITCYPTYGGSGVVATELGIELAQRGHEIHFITYSQPFRLREPQPNIQLPRSRGFFLSSLRLSALRSCSRHPHGRSRARSIRLDLLHVHYAIPHSVSALLAKQMLASSPKPHKLPFVTTLHGTDITLVGLDRSYLPITRFSIEQSDGVTAISNYLRERTFKEFDVRNEIDVIYNFVNCDVYRRTPEVMAKRSDLLPMTSAY